MAKFSETVARMKPGQVIYTPAPVALPDIDRIKFKLVSKNDHGLCQLEISWHGIKLGKLHGKPDGSMQGWRFSDAF